MDRARKQKQAGKVPSQRSKSREAGTERAASKMMKRLRVEMYGLAS